MKIGIFVLILACFSLSQARFYGLDDSQNPTVVQEELMEEVYFHLAQFVGEIRNVIAQLAEVRRTVPKGLKETAQVKDLFSQIDLTDLCVSCQAAVVNLRKSSDQQAIETAFKNFAVKICEEKGLNASVCTDAINTYGNEVFNVLLNRTFDAVTVCEKLHFCPKSTDKDILKDYIKDVLKDKPATNIPVPTKRNTYKILHLTDPHVDLEYQEGMNAFCTQPLCCRASDGLPPVPENASQYWGTLANCDVPERTFTQFLQFAAKNFDIDMLIWTGDNIAHNIWEQNVSTQTVNTYHLTQDLIQYFPSTYIYPMFGNHEAFPCDQFDFIGNGSAWLTSQLSDMWKVWLDPASLSTLKNSSYYSIVNQEHNLKIIALDTVACDSMDFFLIENATDPMGQLAWLRQELYASEMNNQSVFLMGHIPPGDFGCDSEWSARYRALIDRFVNIIRGQFFGHTHNDELQMVRSYADNSPINPIYIAPSFTTYSFLNPSFRIFEIDSDTNTPVNYYQYRLNLTFWNQNTTGPIEWDLAYDLLSEYGLSDMSAHSIDNLIEIINEDDTVAQMYWYNLVSGGTDDNKTLSKRDIAHLYCEAKHSVSYDAFECLGLNATTSDLLDIAQQVMEGAWSYATC